MAKLRIVLLSMLVLGLFPLAGMAQVEVFFPVELATPATPIGVGNAATGGQTLTLTVAGAFAGPMDLFLGILPPASVSSELFLFDANGGIQPFSVAGLVPWRQGVASVAPEINGTAIAGLSTTVLPAGIYHLVLAASPTGTGAISNIWQTHFGASPVPGNVRVATAPMSGAQAVPPVSTPATGTGQLTVVLDNGQIAGTQTFSGLTSGIVASHIHTGLAGANGPVIVNFTGPTGVTAGTWSTSIGAALTADQITAFLNDGLYFQIHTPINTAGELRGQIIP